MVFLISNNYPTNIQIITIWLVLFSILRCKSIEALLGKCFSENIKPFNKKLILILYICIQILENIYTIK